jgi:2-amino-4-hydroxy-6-hydroxymethyldihydropteridine diphosphokinase
MTQRANLVVIAIGSNVAKTENVPAALNLLHAKADLDVQAVSDVLETVAVGPDGQPSGQENFHNLAVLADTSLNRDDLQVQLRALETDLGRRRTTDKFAPRPIDFDIAIFVDYHGTESQMVYVAADVASMPHVAIPIAQILPDWRHPQYDRTMRQIAADLSAQA